MNWGANLTADDQVTRNTVMVNFYRERISAYGDAWRRRDFLPTVDFETILGQASERVP